jgi:hypothetical protein
MQIIIGLIALLVWATYEWNINKKLKAKSKMPLEHSCIHNPDTVTGTFPLSFYVQKVFRSFSVTIHI